MLRWFHRVPALIALMVSLAPWTSGAIAVAHSLTGHELAPMAHVPELEATLHGHAHHEGIPSHSHRLTAPTPSISPVPVFAMEHTHPALPSMLQLPLDTRFATGSVSARPFAPESPPAALSNFRV